MLPAACVAQSVDTESPRCESKYEMTEQAAGESCASPPEREAEATFYYITFESDDQKYLLIIGKLGSEGLPGRRSFLLI